MIDAPSTLRRAAPHATPAATSAWLPAWLRRVLRVSLVAKIVGANALVAAAAATALVLTPHALTDGRGTAILAAALLVAFALDTLLVVLALRPVREIEAVAGRVWRGDFDARVTPSPVADAELARLGRTLNVLLDGMASDRERMRALAAQTIRAQDTERARIARELHDSIAQTLAALTYQLSAAGRDTTDPATAAHLADLCAVARGAVEEVRTLSHVVHPRVLDDLGLAAALEWLGRTVAEHSGLRVVVDAPPSASAGVEPELAAALYRVAQEALRNAERHAAAESVRVTLARDATSVTLVIADDGRGFSLADAEARRPGMGLFAMRERIALTDGSLHIDSAPGQGTHVRASVPVRGAA